MSKSKPAAPAGAKELDLAYQLWSKGDISRARQEAKRVLAQNPEGETLARAQRLLADTGPDPRALQAGAGGAAFVLVILLLLFAR
jgi:hypothetical protein